MQLCCYDGMAPVEPVTPSKPATGDAGIVVYLGLGVMALAGGWIKLNVRLSK